MVGMTQPPQHMALELYICQRPLLIHLRVIGQAVHKVKRIEELDVRELTVIQVERADETCRKRK
jgi:hypothetical protein